MAQESGVAIGELKVDGGMAANNLLMQFQADILNRAVVRPQNLETTAQGAIYAAALATGAIASLDEITERWRMERRFIPTMDAETRARLLAKWSKAITRSFDWTD
jgi:glycerol kinase